ncbi:MAG: thioredoxin, partial [Actinobacteria bacterium]|nr:thioredoxin [Actinomycetota bacterium]
MTGLAILCAAVVLTVVTGLVLQQRSGTLRATRPDDSLRLVLAELGAVPGERATLLQFSSAFCAPC